jgi:hypothetical protein
VLQSDSDYSASANAHLIAAAPDLLEAVVAMVDWDNMENRAPPYDSDGGAHFAMRTEACRRSFALAHAAIAKAEGK